MKERDFQTLSLFLILAALTVLFVMGSRAVLFAPLSAEMARPASKSAGKSQQRSAEQQNAAVEEIFNGQDAKKGP